jgi:hypothetical protein
MIEFNQAKGAQLAIAGAECAANNAGIPWKELAYAALKEYRNVSNTFMTEDISNYAYTKGLDNPPDGRAWGAIIHKAKKDGIIVKVGYAPKKTKHCHSQPISVWEFTKNEASS